MQFSIQFSYHPPIRAAKCTASSAASCATSSSSRAEQPARDARGAAGSPRRPPQERRWTRAISSARARTSLIPLFAPRLAPGSGLLHSVCSVGKLWWIDR